MIQSLLDLDLYKLTMGQFAYVYYPDLVVEFAFKNRSGYKLADVIPQHILIDELRKVKNLKLTQEHEEYLRKQDKFRDDYVDFLRDELSMGELSVSVIDGEFDIRARGHWKHEIYWETFVLSTVNELYYKYKYLNSGDELERLYKIGKGKVNHKIDLLQAMPSVITDFGTRRRFSYEWQDFVITQIKDQPFFAGTSNVHFAHKYDLKPIGTNAHELYMILAALLGKSDEGLLGSHSVVLQQWWDMYGEELSVGLTDTFGTKFFFEDFVKFADKWKGMRHDSGCPFKFGDSVINYYKDNNIDPNKKLIVFSDGLDVYKILKLDNYFENRIGYAFGWGTTLTNDMGLETLSIVMKATYVERDGDEGINRSTVKLSDNLNKAMGDPVEIDRYKKIFGYANEDSEELRV